MSDPEPLGPHEQALLDEIDAMLAAEGASRQAAHSLLGLSAHLASTQPRPGADFKHRLWLSLEQRLSTQSAPSGLTTNGHFGAFSRRRAGRRTQAFRPLLPLGRRALLAVGLAALVLLLLIAPTTQALVTQIIQRLQLGQYSWVEQRDSTATNARPVAPPNQWLIETDLGLDGGPLPPGASPEVRVFSRFTDAQAALGFHLWAPADLPPGYALREVRLPPAGVSERAYLLFGGPARDIVLILTPVGERPGDEPNQVVVRASLTVTDGTVEPVEVDGHPAAWVDGKMLVWEAEGVNFILGSLSLADAEAIRVAESLR